MRFVIEPLLPKGYTRLEYLESTGTQYIDTGFIPTNDNFQFETKMFSPNTSAYFGYRSVNSGTATGDMRWFFNYSDGRVAIRYGNTTENSTLSFDTQTTHKFYFNGSSLYIDDVNYLTTTKKYTTPVYKSFYLFSVNASGYYSTDIAKFVGKIYYCKIWNNNTLVRDFIPALNSSNVPGMYDRVNHVFYTNAGTGEFVYKVAEPIDDNTIDNPKYQQVEYLESNGTQYIDTGLSMPNGFRANGLYEIIQTGTTGGIIGTYSGTSPYKRNFYDYTPDNKWLVGFGGDAYQYFGQADTNIKYLFNISNILNKETIEVNGTSYTFSPIGTPGAKINYNLYLFALNVDNAPNHYSKIKLYKLKIYDENDTLVRHFIPVIRKADNKPGMYDKVTGNFYTNLGTGEFTYGDKVNQALPTTYEKLEYIESTTTTTGSGPYIDTGIEALNTTSFMIDFSFNNTAYGQGMGQGYLAGKRFSVVGFYISGGSTYFGYAYNSWYDTDVAIDTNRHTFELDAYNKKYYLDNHTYNIPNVSYTSEGKTIGLFCRICNSNGTTYPNWFCAGKMYSARIKQNGILVRDLVPALRKADNKPGMYDFVSGQFFTNAGTGEFTYAYPVKPLSNSLTRMIKTVRTKPYKCELEYIEATGTQWFDTGISATGDSYEADYKLRTSNNTFIIAGARSETQHLNLGQFEAGSTQRLYLAYYDTYWQSGTQPITANTEFVTHAVLKYGEQYAMLNGTKVCANTRTGREAINLNIYLLKRNYYGETDTIAPMKGRLYFFKLWRNGVLVRDYIPVKDMNDVVCLYDKVSGTLFYNKGTGTLGAGKEIHLIESLESTGTQYIDTGIYGFADFEIGIKLRTNAANVAVFCTNGYRMERYNVNNPYWRFRNNTDAYNSEVRITEYHVMAWKNNQIYADGIKLQDLNKTWNVDANTTLCGISASMFPNIIYFCKLWDPTDNTLLRDFVPARDENNQGYLFDKVTHTLFGNNGSGAFTLGDDIPEVTTTTTTRFVQGGISAGIYKSLNYLESTGVQYIETKIYPSPKAEFEMKAKLTEVKVNSCFFGASTDWAWGSSANSSLAFANSSSGQVFCVYSNSGQTGTITAIPGGTYADFTTEFKNYTWKINGTTISEFTPIESWTNANMPAINIFNRKIYNQGSQDTKGKYRIYYLKIWDNGVLVGDFVPVLRKYDQKPGMYDYVTNTFYTNMGTGDDFLYG